MATAFATPGNNVSTTVGATTTGSGLPGTPYNITLATGGGAKFPALPSPNTYNWYYRVTVCQVAFAYSPTATTSNYTIYKADSISGDNLHVVSVLEGTTDRVYNVGDIVEVRVTAGTLDDVQNAVNALEAGGGLSIGNTVTGGTANRVLYEGASHVLADSVNFQFDGNNLLLGNPTATTTKIRVRGQADGTNNPSFTLEADGRSDKLRTNYTQSVTTSDHYSEGNVSLNTYYVPGTGWMRDNTSASCIFIDFITGDSTGLYPTASIGVYGQAAGSNPISSFNTPAAFFSDGTTQFGVTDIANPPATTVQFNTASTSKVNVSVKAITSQTADLQQWQNSTPTTVSSVDANGVHCMVTQSTGAAPAGTTHAGGLIFDTSNNKLWAYTGSAWKSVTLA